MQFEEMEGWEWVRPTETRKGYWRRKPDRSHPSPRQSQIRMAFGRMASLTKGITGTIKLKNGREISISAYALKKPIKNDLTNLKSVTKNIQHQDLRYAQEEKKSWADDMADIIEALKIQKEVEAGVIPRELGILLLLEKMEMQKHRRRNL